MFATDGSGGPSAADQRYSAAGFAVVAFRLKDSVLECVATISGTFAGAQTAQRAEVFAFTTLLARTSGNVDCTVDSQYVKKQWSKPHPRGAHVDLWEEAFAHGQERGICATWINSHLDQSSFQAKFGRDQMWRREANDVVDKLASEAAARGFRPERMQFFKASDAHVEAVLRQLAMRGATILQAKKGTHPSLPVSDPKKVDCKPKGRKYTKDVGRGPSHSTRKNYMQHLVDGKEKSSHAWRWRKSCLECATCRLTISASNTWKIIHAKIKRPCKARNLDRHVRAGELTQEQADKLRAEAAQSCPEVSHADAHAQSQPAEDANISMPANVSHARAKFLDDLAASTENHDSTRHRLKVTKHQMRCERCGATMPNRAGQEVLQRFAVSQCIIVHPTRPKQTHASHPMLGVGPRLQCIRCFGTLYFCDGRWVGRNANEFPQNLIAPCTHKPHQQQGRDSEHLRQALTMPHVAQAYGQSQQATPASDP